MVDNRHEGREVQASPYDGLLEAAFQVPIFLLRAPIGSPPTWNMQLRAERIVENWNKTSQHADDKSIDFRLLTELVSVLIAELGKHIHSVLACPGEHAMTKREIRHIAYDVQCNVMSSWLEQTTISELRNSAQLFTCPRADHSSIDQEAAWRAARSEIQFERFRAMYNATVRVLLPTYNVEFL
jgi:hypothetical protein